MPTFFTAETLAFLDELRLNNLRSWFEDNRQRYDDFVREPARAFIVAMRPRLQAISQRFVADDRKAGGSLMRIFRDMRFSPDKSPYKTNIGVQFRHGAGKDVHAPGLYVHIEPSDDGDGGMGCFVGAGMWRPPSPQLKAIRARIDEAPARWRGIVEDRAFVDRFDRGGEKLSRVPRGYAKDHPMASELMRQSHIVSAPLTMAEVLGDRLDQIVTDHFIAARDYTRFLCEAVGVDF